MPWIGLAVGAGLLVFSMWGIRVCRHMLIPTSIPGPPDAGTNTLAMVLSWMVVFGPFAVLGVFILRSTVRRMRRRAALSLSQSPSWTQGVMRVQVIPPQTSNTPQSDVPHWHVSKQRQEPLDDATSRRLNELGERAAIIVNATVGLLLLIGGLSGFMVMWIYSRGPAASPPSFAFRLPFRFVIETLVWCGLCVLAGLAMLRHAFKKADTSWLAPLHIFGGIVMRRAAAEELARRRRRLEDKNSLTRQG